MKIKNITGTSDAKCLCDSWLKHWENFSGRTTKYCIVKDCLEKELVGAHVQKAEGNNESWYILPICNKHNQSKDVLEVSDAWKLVSANKKETCDKPTKP